MDEPLTRLHTAVTRTRELTRDRPFSGRTHDDADDVTGTFATDSAVDFDPFPLLGALHAAGVRVVVIGQVAGILHGSTELTGDLDLLWDGDPESADGLVAAFRSVGGRLTDDDGKPVALDPAAFELPKVLFESELASGDCCTPALPWGDLPIRQFLERAATATGPDGIEVHYLSRTDLIRMRRAAGRPKDVRRANELDR